MRPNACALRAAWVCLLLLFAHDGYGAFAGLVSANSPASVSVSRQLQDGATNAANTTNTTTTGETVSPCVQTIRWEHQSLALEQCEIDYREADCDGANMVSWNTLNGPLIGVYVFGVLLMFVSLSVVCDEFFVPALEIIVKRWEVDPDIAGATLMAAGGSAPELFTSFIGTFAQSSVGFGTIVGSAVFNVLFVIGTCAVVSKEVLHLTWWPLARDCSYYCFSLMMLAIFFGRVENKPTGDSDSWVQLGSFCYWKDDGDWAKPQDCAAIHTWEAATLFAMYFGYILVMAFNRTLAEKMDALALTRKAATVESTENPAQDSNPAEGGIKTRSTDGHHLNADVSANDSLGHTSAYRAGLWSMLMEERTVSEQAELHLVSHVRGNVDQTFQAVDKDNSGYLDVEETVSIHI